MSDDAPLRLLLLAPDALVRAGLSALLGAEDDVVLVEERGERDDDIDVVLLDASADLEADDGDQPVVALCEDLEQARLALHDGARAVLSRGARAARIIAAARAAAAGLSVIDGPFAQALLDAPRAGHGADEDGAGEASVVEPSASPTGESLTPREHEVLSLLAEGLSNREIAEALEISAHTAKFHVNAILDKLDARTRTEAVVRAARLGLLML